MVVGKRLAEAREKKGYSQDDVAEILHVSRQAISNWEREVSTPDISLLKKFSEICNVQLDELVRDVEMPEPITGDVTSVKEMPDARGDSQRKKSKQQKTQWKKLRKYIIAGTIVLVVLAVSVVLYLIYRDDEENVLEFHDMTIVHMDEDAIMDEKIDIEPY